MLLLFSLGLGPATCEFLPKNDGVLGTSSSYKCLQCLQYYIYGAIDKDSVSKFTIISSLMFHDTELQPYISPVYHHISLFVETANILQ